MCDCSKLPNFSLFAQAKKHFTTTGILRCEHVLLVRTVSGPGDISGPTVSMARWATNVEYSMTKVGRLPLQSSHPGIGDPHMAAG